MNVIVMGASGRMGSRVIRLVQQDDSMKLVGAVEGRGHASVGKVADQSADGGIQITDDLAAVIPQGEVIIDFTTPEATLKHLDLAVESGKPMVIGTTGLRPEERDRVRQAAERIPCVFSPNMSVAMNVMFRVAGELARLLGQEYDMEITEAHHRLKEDAPSGTALRLAEIVAQACGRELDQVATYSRKGQTGKRPPSEIGIQVIRAGDIVGEHTLIFGGLGERLEITHRAQSRDNFARGGLLAARWVIKQPPGLYEMAHVLGLSP